ncbi:MAG: 30S ribosomal protein S18 [Patescibacteria group bacterium]|nr:30S ribosomal protein S18 [Patescibacteria group bacterium]
MPRKRSNKKKNYHKGPCFYCQSGRDVDYKDVLHLKRFLTRRGKIRPREQTGLCARHQREIATAIKRAREAALISYVNR